MTKFQKAALVLLALLFTVNIYRAATQSVTVAEAVTYNNYASIRLFTILTKPFDANNHVLHTILCRLSTRTLGVSELSLRLPSLLGCMLYFFGIYRLSQLWFGAGLTFLTAVAGVGVNPVMLDFLSTARGYSLACAFLVLALYHLSLYLTVGRTPWSARDPPVALFSAGLFLGFSIAANLTMAVPTVAMCIAFLLEAGRMRMWPGFWRLIDELLLPATIAAGVLLIVPLTRATSASFSLGANTAAESWKSLFGPIGWGPPFLIILVAARITRTLPLMLAGGTLVISCAALTLSHYALHLPYPQGRTGLYLVVLFTLAWVALLEGPVVRFTGTLMAVAALAVYVSEFRLGPYADWPLDAATKNTVNAIRARHTTGEVSIGASGMLYQSLNFYRRRYHLSWMKPAQGDTAGKYDFYVLLPQDEDLILKRNLKVVYSNGGEVVATGR